MRDLRDVNCLTVMDLARLRESRWIAYQRSDVELILDTLDVAVAIIRGEHVPTSEQAEALGIFREGT